MAVRRTKISNGGSTSRRTDRSASATYIAGSTSTKSDTRISRSSTKPPAYPAIPPTNAPMSNAPAVATSDRPSEIRAP